MHTLMLTDIAPSATCHLPILCRPPPGARRPDARRAWNLPPNAFAVVAGPSDFMNPLKTQTPFTSTVPTSSSTQSSCPPVSHHAPQRTPHWLISHITGTTLSSSWSPDSLPRRLPPSCARSQPRPSRCIPPSLPLLQPLAAVLSPFLEAHQVCVAHATPSSRSCERHSRRFILPNSTLLSNRSGSHRDTVCPALPDHHSATAPPLLSGRLIDSHTARPEVQR
jgi:hypothetical protein